VRIIRFRYRIFFIKTGAARFIGHLDLQSLFQRCFKRSGLPVAYSEGFNPHQLLSFAAPLPLGTAGLGEILEVFLTEQIEPEAIVSALAPQMPGGISILRVQEVSPTGKGAAALARAATYRIIFSHDPKLVEGLDKIIAEMLASGAIEVEKRTKKGRAMADIRPDILMLENASLDGEICLKAALSTGSERNLKPEIVAAYILDTLGIIGCDVAYERIEILLREVGA